MVGPAESRIFIAQDGQVYRVYRSPRERSTGINPDQSALVFETEDGDEIVIEVSDTGPGVRKNDPQGRGLVGIAERVSMCGGTLEHGDGEHGGFRLRAVLPLP